MQHKTVAHNTMNTHTILDSDKPLE